MATGIDPLPILLDLHRAPHLWDRDITRTPFEGTPFAGTSDIWVRFRAAVDVKGLHSHKEEYRSVYWPAWAELPALRPLLLELANG